MTDAMMTAPAMPARSTGVVAGVPLYVAATVGFGLLMLPTLGAMALDDRLYRGIAIWMKPLKFQIALALFFATLAVYARWLPESMLRARWHRVYAASVVAAAAAEIVWISGAAALGTASHFNTTPVGTALYALMGVLAVWFTGATLVYGIAIARSRRPADPALRAGLALGLILTFVLTVVFAGTMSNGGGHLVGGGASDAGGFWLMGWSRTAGDLRVAHFFGTHAMHVVPAAALAATLLLGRRPALVATVGVAAAYAGFSLAVFRQAQAGLPFLPGFG